MDTNTCRIGVADLPHIPPPGVVEMADEALYAAKHEGRNRICIARAKKESDLPDGGRRVA